MRRVALGSVPATDDLLRYFFDSPWIYIREYLPEENDPKPHEISWVAGARDQHRITFVNDHVLDVQFFSYETEEPDAIPKIETRLFSSPFDILKDDEVWRRFREATNDEDQLKNFKRLMVIGLEQQTPELLETVEKMLHHPNGEVRSESIAAMSYLQWPEVPTLMKPLLEDANEEVRRRAQLVIDGFKRAKARARRAKAKKK